MGFNHPKYLKVKPSRYTVRISEACKENSTFLVDCAVLLDALCGSLGNDKASFRTGHPGLLDLPGRSYLIYQDHPVWVSWLEIPK